MVINTQEAFVDFLSRLSEQTMIAIDTETSGLDPFGTQNEPGAEICGVAVCFTDMSTYYLPFRHKETDEPQLDISCLHQLFDVIKANDISLINHNIKFDVKMFWRDGIDISGFKLIDTIILFRLYNENEPMYKLKYLGKKYIEPSASDNEAEVKKWLRKNKKQTYDYVPIEILSRYAEKDVFLTYKLYEMTINTIKYECMDRVYDLEHTLINHLIDAEINGININVEYAKKMLQSELEFSEDIKKRIYAITGYEFNISSNLQLTEAMKSLGIESDVKGKSGDIWNDEVLANIEHPIAALVAYYRTSSTLQNTYYSRFAYRCDKNNRLHCNFKQQGARTGRLSCEEPNLQNIPSVKTYGFTKFTKSIDEIKALKYCDVELSKDRNISFVRRCFIPSPDHKLFMFDYKQMELRVFVDYAQEQQIVDKINAGADAHTAFAQILFGDDVMNDIHQSVDFRSMIKDINFGLLYGMGSKSLAKHIHKTEQEAKDIMSDYYRTYPRIRAFMQAVISKIRSKGYIFNKFGRRRRLEQRFAYKGVNSLIQGGCADMLKQKMVELCVFLADKKSKMLLTVHDELVFDIHNTEYLDILPKIYDIMINFDVVKIKMDTDVEFSNFSWLDKVELKWDLFNLHKEQQQCADCSLCELEYNKYEPEKGYGKLIGYGNGKVMFVAQNPSYVRYPNCITPIDAGIGKSFIDLYTNLTGDYNFYFTNVVKCSTVNNSEIEQSIVSKCTNKYLVKEIDIIKPKLIVAIGKYAKDYFKGEFNKTSNYNGITVYSIWHPSYIKRNASLKDEYIKSIEYISTLRSELCK